MNIVVTESLRQAAQVQTRAASAVGPQVSEAARRLAECLQADRRVYVIGNGGSAADAQHFAAEFTGKYLRPRLPLPVLALTTDTSALTCIGNDYGYDAVFSRQVEAFARPGDILFAISTSGNSVNVIEAARSARRKGVSVIGMTGRAAAGLDAFCDLVLKVPSPVTARVQECQMTILHIICDLTERILLDSRRPAPKNPGVLPPALLSLRQEWRRQGLTVVSTNGCFDVLHAGHLDSLDRAAALGDVLVVLLNSDESVRRAKGPARPVNPQQARARLLQALTPVAYVCVFDQDNPAAALAELRPDVHCKGEEYAAGQPVPEREVVERFGGRMEFLPRTVDVSTTQILDRLEVV
ncbi:SIS domain-containing protein [Kineosporia rhizophila]|uniref:SIS domain-containing protein n=1 Tax=Kineosporia TaxID=49184 RepID=UPI001E2992BF|nr:MULTISPECIES: SIS domain-containing protein [Kineosporia]MCE0537722.1 SIS domain-containing protein [Kineosporia rhizophila]